MTSSACLPLRSCSSSADGKYQGERRMVSILTDSAIQLPAKQHRRTKVKSEKIKGEAKFKVDEVIKNGNDIQQSSK